MGDHKVLTVQDFKKKEKRFLRRVARLKVRKRSGGLKKGNSHLSKSVGPKGQKKLRRGGRRAKRGSVANRWADFWPAIKQGRGGP